MIDGISNVIGGVNAVKNGILGNDRGDEHNYMKEYYVNNYGELGKNMYYSTRFIGSLASYSRTTYCFDHEGRLFIAPEYNIRIELPDQVNQLENVTTGINGYNSIYEVID